MTEQVTSDRAQDILRQLLTDGSADPYPLYGWLREHEPVFYDFQFGAYMLSRYADCSRVLRNPALFRGPETSELMAVFPQARRHDSYRILLSALPALNPPQHTRVRGLLARDFTPRRVERLRPEVERLCDELLTDVERKLSDGAVIDLHREVSTPIPMQVAARLIGIPGEDLPKVAALVPAMVHVVNQAATEAQLDAADQAFAEFGDYLRALITARRGDPCDDLISALVSAHGGMNDQLSEAELIVMLQMLWAAGFETVAIALDNAVLTLLRDRRHGQWLTDESSALAWVDELLRWDTPGSISTGRRYATADTELGGIRIPAGAQVRLLLNAANRDPAAYPDSDRFDPRRSGPPALAFGAGIHFCMGASLTRLEMSALLRRIQARMPALRLAAEPVRRRSLPLRDFESFPVCLG